MSSKAKSSDQPTISSFFPKTPAKKRGSTPVDLTVDSDDDEFSFEPPSKRTRLGDNNGRTDSQEERGPGISKFFTPVKGARSQKPPSRSILESPVSKYRFQGEESPQRADNDPNSTETELREKQARRDAFRNRLGDHFKPKSPKDLVVAESEVDYTRLDASGAETTEESENSEVEILEEPPAASRLQNFASTRSEPKSSSASQTKGKGRSKKTEEIGPSGKKYTPLEKQVLACKEAHPDCLLLFEVGYKYKFFGEDATTASKELGIVAFPDRNFMSAMIPVTRKIVHVKRLISQGYKVGIIGQTETAAVKKAGDNRNAPFERKLVAMYTAATFIDDLNSVEDAHDGSPSSPPSIGCFVESQLGGMGADERVTIGMVSVVPSTGEVTYDEWQDGHMRTELETRITHLRPSELLVPVDLSKPTKKMLESVTGNKRFNAGTKIRVETFNETMAYSDAFTYLTAFYSRKQTSPGRQEDSAQPDDTMARVVGFPKKVIVALAHIIGYLKDFGIADTLLQASFFSTFATRTHMLLPSTTLNNLEIYRNSTDFSEKGSLFWILNRTTTKFGARLLKSWVGRPLVDPIILKERIDAVDEVVEGPAAIEKIKSLLKGLPDLVKGLAKISYGYCTPKELASLFTAFQRIGNAFELLEQPSQAGFKSPIWNDIVASLPLLRKPMSDLMSNFNISKARNEDPPKAELWISDEKYPELEDRKFSIIQVETELEEQLKTIRKTLRRPMLKWKTVSDVEYLIELPQRESKTVPANWSRISATKTAVRFHTPEVKKLLGERAFHKETLITEGNKAWQDFLKECSEHYGVFRDVTNKLAIADCLLSLSTVSLQHGYTRPEFVDDNHLEIINGRHPMVEALRDDPFVPNSISIGGKHPRTKIITGPNMNGKSTTCRTVALIAIMAQIGSYVPASQCNTCLHDAILTRMGAADEIAGGRSTFMVEMQETSDIMKQATSRSLLILDELGRGTSTFDGVAIASAVLQHLVDTVKPKLLFITHYPLIATEFGRMFSDVENLHMGFAQTQGKRQIDFLYKLEPGIASGSFGIECARLAGLSDKILDHAYKQSHDMKILVDRRTESGRLKNLLKACLQQEGPTEDKQVALKQLQTIINDKDS